jgi:xanthine/CO dehydrogenase XdhC/CoxF family maturation factor
MRELDRIVDAYTRLARTGRIGALASVVRTSGSTYRRIGAHMLVTEDGEVTGAISGGCLERDIRRHASWVMQSGEPKALVSRARAADVRCGARRRVGKRIQQDCVAGATK